MITVEFNLGNQEGYVARALEEMFPFLEMTQNKSSDEYLIEDTTIETLLDLDELMVLSEYVNVLVCPDAIELS